MISDIVNPPTLQPSSNCFSYVVKTVLGEVIENYSGKDLIVTNTKAASFYSNQTSIIPSSYSRGKQANYTISFEPVNY